MQNAVTSISFLFITALINHIGGVNASAAAGVVGRFNSFMFMPTIAMSLSVATLSAQNIGAGRLARAVSACRWGTLISVAISYPLFVVCQLFPGAIIGAFNKEAEVIAEGIQRPGQRDQLVAMGCGLGQGAAIAAAVRASQTGDPEPVPGLQGGDTSCGAAG